jgi:hypothetical protein
MPSGREYQSREICHVKSLPLVVGRRGGGEVRGWWTAHWRPVNSTALGRWKTGVT